MSHLTDEQFEDVMQGKITRPEHLESCDQCKQRLVENEAISGRVKRAFSSIEPDEELAEAIRRKLSAQSLSNGDAKLRHRVHAHWRGWVKVVCGAAAAVFVVVPVLFYLMTPSPAVAGQAELVRIHKENLSVHHEFHSESDPEKLAEYFKDRLGFNLYMPVPDSGMALRGCCVRRFRGQIVGSYVVDTPRGVMSVVVVTDPPESFGMEGRFEREGYVYWKSSFAKSNMVTVRIGDYSYCAVGEISHEYLTDLLSRLLPGK